jgi:hypothetical protein
MDKSSRHNAKEPVRVGQPRRHDNNTQPSIDEVRRQLGWGLASASRKLG